MKKGSILSVLALLSLLLTSCFTYEDVDVKGIEDVKVKNFSKSGIEVDIAVHLVNPNNYKITVTGSDLDVFIGGKSMGKARIKNRVVLPKKSDKVQHITVVADFKDMASVGLPGLLSIFSGGSLQLGIKGDIKGKAMMITRKFPVDFTERVSL